MTDLTVKIPAPAWSEAQRLAVLRRFDILDTEPEQAFDDIARMAAQLCQAPVGLITFIDEGRHWFKAVVGLEAGEAVPPFCAQAILQPGLLIVPDARKDPRFAGNPFSRSGPALRFYAGAVIRTDEGLPLGTVCAMDRTARPEGLTPEQAETLAALARAVMNLLRLRRAEQRLALEQDPFAQLADALPQMVWSSRSDGHDEYSNAHWYRFTGASPGSALGRGWIEMIHPDDREEVLARWQHASQTGEPYEATCRLRHHSGEYRWMLARALPARDARGAIERWFGTYTDIHAWKESEALAAESRERYRALLEASAVMLWLATPEGMLTHIEGALDAGGLAETSYRGMDWLDAVHPEDRARVRAAWQWALSSGSAYQNEFRIRLADGEHRWMLANAVAVRNPDGSIREWVGSLADIHDRKQAEEKLRASEERLRLALHAGRMFAWEQDLTTNYVTRSQNTVALLGIGSGTLDEFLERVHPEDRGLRQHFAQQAKAQGSYASEFRYILPSGKVIWLGSRAELASPNRLVGVTFDITERRVAEEEIWRTANHDSLTGLPNRGLFHQRLEQALADAKRQQSRVNLLLIDLDDFKDVNDTLGHDAGDALLKETAARLSAMIRSCDTVARLGGDEFAILVLDPYTLQDAADLAGRLVARLREPFTYKKRVVSSRASIGVAAFPEHHFEPAELMKNADIALYRAKAQGRNRVLTYSPLMRREIEERVALGADLREALARDQMIPFYQPKVSLETGRIVGFEVLARWHHPSKGLLTPAYFGAAFDDADLAPAIRRQLVAKVVGDMREWLDGNLEIGRIAMNLSSADFSQPRLVEEILDVLQGARIPPSRLEVEITETVLLGRSAEGVSTILQQFRDTGVSIALDDFGTGYASLMHLKHFPVDHVKIDRAFIKDLGQNGDDEVIVGAVIGLGRSLGLRVTAEGVESRDQERHLRRLGCEDGQGFLYSVPVPGCGVPPLLLRGL
ncbi:bifunctional diguanylate cyclase/phosphodiesterase [Microvirga arsenatis]|uniref:EAL domain-containing protein n=1 Tax=Microvirga arsenatis TaxID=2692265 RepID=A0ABW9Z6S7_9HYPH|nr:EAL domain-containing protein [Microvirga arsenatis]NBJ12582.1 EAL domain-containing protein [Microvirga arsenatis]NBJ27385.1 EAL domain-containing protein [Microvirga arsenatis]